uniref:Auxin-responsive protein n=1 Tax=Oryza punctata TaxID=4537 RepID=A0A0E0JSZ9_ORYPU
MAAAVAAARSSTKGVRRTKSLISRTLERCKSGLSNAGGGGGRSASAAAAPVAGCFSVYVGPERERFVVRTEYANHPLFRRLLDDAEREYGYAAQGPLALPCPVDAFLDVLWQMERDGGDDDDDDLSIGGGGAASRSPICGLPSCGSKGRAAAGYRMLSPARMTSILSRSSSPMATPSRKR